MPGTPAGMGPVGIVHVLLVLKKITSTKIFSFLYLVSYATSLEVSLCKPF
jgi:hypothetical protein